MSAEMIILYDPNPLETYKRVSEGLKNLEPGTLFDLVRRCITPDYRFPSFSNTQRQLEDLNLIQKNGEITAIVKGIILISVERNRGALSYKLVGPYYDMRMGLLESMI